MLVKKIRDIENIEGFHEVFKLTFKNNRIAVYQPKRESDYAYLLKNGKLYSLKGEYAIRSVIENGGDPYSFQGITKEPPLLFRCQTNEEVADLISILKETDDPVYGQDSDSGKQNSENGELPWEKIDWPSYGSLAAAFAPYFVVFGFGFSWIIFLKSRYFVLCSPGTIAIILLFLLEMIAILPAYVWNSRRARRKKEDEERSSREAFHVLQKKPGFQCIFEPYYQNSKAIVLKEKSTGSLFYLEPYCELIELKGTDELTRLNKGKKPKKIHSSGRRWFSHSQLEVQSDLYESRLNGFTENGVCSVCGEKDKGIKYTVSEITDDTDSVRDVLICEKCFDQMEWMRHGKFSACTYLYDKIDQKNDRTLLNVIGKWSPHSEKISIRRNESEKKYYKKSENKEQSKKTRGGFFERNKKYEKNRLKSDQSGLWFEEILFFLGAWTLIIILALAYVNLYKYENERAGITYDIENSETGSGGKSVTVSESNTDSATEKQSTDSYWFSMSVNEPESSETVFYLKSLCDEVKERTGGAVEIVIYADGSLIAPEDVPMEVKRGVADIGWVDASLFPDFMMNLKNYIVLAIGTKENGLGYYVIMNKDSWESIPKEYRDILDEVFEKACIDDLK